MARFSAIIVAYFVMGAVMWGGGAIAWDDSGVGTFFIDDVQDGATANESVQEDLAGQGGSIQNVATTLTGIATVVWTLMSGITMFLFWPLAVLISNNAPTELVVLLGGTPTVAFWGAIIRLIRQSA